MRVLSSNSGCPTGPGADSFTPAPRPYEDMGALPDILPACHRPRAGAGASEMETFLAVCDRLALPLCLFDERAALVWCNASAREMATGHSRRGQSGFVALFAELQCRLRQQIGSARYWTGDRIDAAVEALADTIIELVRIIDGDAVFVVGLFLRKPAAERGVRQRLARFGLTRTETWIAEQMLGGRTTAEITQANNVSLHTVRTHIKHIYSKLGVHCREKMIAKLLSA